MINVAVGANIRENDMKTKSFSAQGFPEGNFTRPSFANSYPEGGKPGYAENKNRNANFYLNGGYVYDGRYLLDVNLRSDGTSDSEQTNVFLQRGLLVWLGMFIEKSL
mgnify:CR=1 FL=1